MIVDIKIKDDFFNIKKYEIKLVANFFITKNSIILEKFDGDVVEIGYFEIIKISCFG